MGIKSIYNLQKKMGKRESLVVRPQSSAIRRWKIEMIVEKGIYFMHVSGPSTVDSGLFLTTEV